MASPFLIEDNAIKYIDYDLDLRVFSNGNIKILDKGEYKYHKIKMNYNESIDIILKKELDSLIDMVKKKEIAFNEENIKKYYEKYKKIKNNEKKAI